MNEGAIVAFSPPVFMFGHDWVAGLGAWVQAILGAPIWLAGCAVGLYLLVTAFTRRARARADRPAEPAAPRESLPGDELKAALRACRGAFSGIGLFSAVLNVLMLTGSLFMLEIYDRVLPSRSVPTLIALSALAAFLFIGQGILEIVRARVLTRIGASLSEALSPRIYEAVATLSLKRGAPDASTQVVRDLESVRSFLSGLGPTALFDFPWIPIYVGVIFAFHPMLGFMALTGALALIALTVSTEILTRDPVRSANRHASSRDRIADASRRNAEALAAMGMTGAIGARWSGANQNFLASQQEASDIAGGLGVTSKVIRIMLQSGMLGLGAYLVIRQEATAGVIIAASILVGRALAPVDIALANWKGFVGARQSWARLTETLALLPAAKAFAQLPAPRSALTVETVSGVPPGASRIVVKDVAFALARGQALGVIGPSASGKSSLARLLVGVWSPIRGAVRLDGAALDQWHPATLGRHIGYLPQAVELLAGSVAENICRFQPGARPEAIVGAAQAAGVHELIVRLPNGYETQVGENGAGLSAGQQQRVALARALFGGPFLIVLDEPNSNLDAEGESALTQVIAGAKERGAIVVVVAHRPSALAAADLILVMKDGRAHAFGPKDDILPQYFRTSSAPPAHLKLVPEAGRSP